jgi:hypothetical protein
MIDMIEYKQVLGLVVAAVSDASLQLGLGLYLELDRGTVANAEAFPSRS